MKILDGKKVSRRILEDIKREIEVRHLKLSLAAVLVGSDRVSEVYVNRKKKVCEEVGIIFELFSFPLDIGEKELNKGITEISENPKHSGVIIQLPLPKHINTQDTLNMVPANKDIDVLSENSLGRFYSGSLNILPPVVSAVASLLDEYEINTKGRNVFIVGTGRLVGKPLTIWLMNQGATVSIANSKTEDLSLFSKNADILISGVGKPNLINGNMIKKGAVIIDAGTTIEGGTLRGDIDLDSVKKVASYIAPVPGGIGPMTVACLIKNLLDLNKK